MRYALSRKLETGADIFKLHVWELFNHFVRRQSVGQQLQHILKRELAFRGCRVCHRTIWD